MNQIDKLREDLKNSPLKMNKLANMVGVSDAHLSMMLSGKATMPDDTRIKLQGLLSQALQIKV